MDGNMEGTPEYHGSLVAFEGPVDAISTQLRLLPSSPKILILPSLQHFLKQEDDDTSFDARDYILKIHDACKARADLAHSFLRESSPSNKRLVFMNGGTASAQMNCITAISQHEAEGDAAKAEVIFNELVRNGVAGLYKQAGVSSRSNSTHSWADAKEEQADLPNDPISKAMRAADALDRETASLQPNTEIDLTIATRRRSMSLPLSRMADQFEDSTPFYVFGASVSEPSLPIQGNTTAIAREVTSVGLGDDNAAQFDKPTDLWTRSGPEEMLNGGSLEPTSPSCVGEAYGVGTPASSTVYDLFTPFAAEFESLPTSPTVVYGEAQVVDIRSSPHSRASRIHKRVKSVDRIYASAIRNQDISLCSSAFETLGSPSSIEARFETPSTPNTESPDSQVLRPKYLSEIPRATFIKPSKPSVRRAPPAPLDLATPTRLPRTSAYVNKATSPVAEAPTYVDRSTWIEICYVDRGVDAEYVESPKYEDFELSAGVPFETVLPMAEDLVIHFQDETRDALLEAVIQGFKTGSYPVSMPPLLPACEDDLNMPGTPTSRGSAPSLVRNRASTISRPEPTPAYHSDDDEYDPFAAHGGYLPPASWPAKPEINEPSTAVLSPAPPTPAQTPPPPALITTSPDKSFHDFSTTDCRTAICVQNSLRSILNIYFSPEDAGYHQFTFPQLPELSSLWKPVFRDAEPGSPRKEKRKVDLILAIGAQKGVSKEFLSAISGSLEKLGAKHNGITRSGRLDLRYLIANAMQAFTSQPLANQTQDNPFANTFLLATLIIPHLETYMAAHSETRLLLLEYPPEHLSTVLALQRLVGVDLLKVAGILSGDSHEQKSTRLGGPPLTHQNSHSAATSISGMSAISSRTSATLLTPTGAKSTEAPTFAKANFLITSSATESEIATLISTIWKILIDISHFYIPDGAPRPSTSHRNSKTNLRDSKDRILAGTPFSSAADYAPLTSAAIMMGFQSPPLSPSQTYVAEKENVPLPLPPPEPPAKLHSSKASISETIKSSKTAKTTKSGKTKLSKMLGVEAEAEVEKLRPGTQASYFDVSDDEHNQFAADERKYMPLFLKKPEVRKGNSRKALKWLGLA